MNKIIQIKPGSPVFSLAVSVILHLILFFLAAWFSREFAENKNIRSLYVQLTTDVFSKETPRVQEEAFEEKVPETLPEKKPEHKKPESGAFFNDKNTDTTGLNNIYSETTLNVKIKYPSGWTFIDQNVKNKLDGVTFWGLTDIYNPPPYIHLEVREKYLFNPSRFKYQTELDDYTIFYNDPEEMADNFTQVIYIRTEDEVDYSLKLIMKGEAQFKTFQPVFFGMLKTFSFGG